jgi:hypothetical protein
VAAPHAGATGNCCRACEQRTGVDAAWLAAARRARLLAWVSLAWMSAEGVVGLVAGARRTVAMSFFLLAPCIAAEAIRDLLGHHTTTPGVLGMAITASSVVFMPALGLAKRRLGTRLYSRATTGEGVQNLLTAAQGAAVLFGLAATAAWGCTGSTRPSPSPWPPWLSVKESRPGAATAAARRLQLSPASSLTCMRSHFRPTRRGQIRLTRPGVNRVPRSPAATTRTPSSLRIARSGSRD